MKLPILFFILISLTLNAKGFHEYDSCSIEIGQVITNPFSPYTSDMLSLKSTCELDSFHVYTYDSTKTLIDSRKYSTIKRDTFINLQHCIESYRDTKNENIEIFLYVEYWLRDRKEELMFPVLLIL